MCTGHFSGTRAKELLNIYKQENDKLMKAVDPQIYAMIIPQNVTTKIAALETYLGT